MKQRLPSQLFSRNLEADFLLENFFVSAVSTIFIIRFYLYVTGYPQIGGSQFHIAHMLWGGLLMLTAIFLLLAFLGRSSRTMASVAGGVGFGAFIDELGKFITRNNDYFFQPTVALLYIIFVLLYFLIRAIDSYSSHSKKEYLLNALELIKDAVDNDMDKEELRLARSYLHKSDRNDPLVKELRKVLDRVVPQPEGTKHLFARVTGFLHSMYRNLIAKRWFVRGVLILFGLNAVSTVLTMLLMLYGVFVDSGVIGGITGELTFPYVAQIVFSTIAACFVLAGAVYIRRSRMTAYMLFRYSVMLSIFFTQFFAFYQYQFNALTGLFANLFLLALIQYMMQEEKRVGLQTQKA